MASLRSRPSAQADALVALDTATDLPWTQYLADKAAYVYTWWTDDSDPEITCGADFFRDWADDVNESYSSYATAAGAAYLSMATTVAAANDTYHASTPDDYIDDVYGEDGDYDTWQSAISDAESAYETAALSAWGGLQKSLAAHDAALESALADTYADILEDLAVD